MKVERFIPAIAILLLLVGIFSTVYVQSLQEGAEGEYITINGERLSFGEIQRYSGRIIKTSEDEYSGISLAEMINKSGVINPDIHKYKITGSDGYSKTVEWKYVKNGVFLMEEKEVIFSDLPKQFWVKDIVDIKVI